MQKVNVKETLPTLPLVIVRRAALPLTPAAEYFCDMMWRAVAHMHPEITKRPKR